MSEFVLKCTICEKLLSLEEAKTDGFGKPVHEACFDATRRENSCAVRQRLQEEEQAAWAAWKAMKTSDSDDQQELTKLSDCASDASTELKLHLYTCSECRLKVNVA
jgi:hypothetical protein